MLVIYEILSSPLVRKEQKKSIDEALLTSINQRKGIVPSAVEYNAEFGLSWSFRPKEPTSHSANTNSSCGATTKDFTNLSAASPFVFCFGFQIVGVFVFQLLIEERHKGLVSSLRKLGLLDSAYWIAWMGSVQLLLLAASVLALIVAGIMEEFTYVLQKLDLGFVLFWMPWFHTGQALSNIFSVIQYGTSYSGADMQQTQLVTDYNMPNYSTFQTVSLGYTFGLMVGCSVVYVALAWICGQAYFTGSRDAVIEGDVRGRERAVSQQEGSIRAYKVSKTFKGVQALKEVFICGYDVDYEMRIVQQSIGVCSQDDFLWDELTAMEHMRIHALFKGLREGPRLQAACENVLSVLGLLERANTLAMNFSGGMKRRLSAAMSIDRVVVLTTHNLEEADYLSDRVLVLHTGQVKAIGDPLSLKQKYGSGYQVRMVVDQSIAKPVAGDIIKVSRLDLLNLARFLEWLESIQARSKAVKEWVISNTTLEQVFLTLCASSETNYAGQLSSTDPMCVLCGRNKRAPCVLLALHDGNTLMLPDALCASCPAFSAFLLPSDELTPLLQSGVNMAEKSIELVQAAHRKAASLYQIEVSNSYNLINEEKKTTEEESTEIPSVNFDQLETTAVLNESNARSNSLFEAAAIPRTYGYSTLVYLIPDSNSNVARNYF
eukprot:gene18669-18968_t